MQTSWQPSRKGKAKAKVEATWRVRHREPLWWRQLPSMAEWLSGDFATARPCTEEEHNKLLLYVTLVQLFKSRRTAFGCTLQGCDMQRLFDLFPRVWVMSQVRGMFRLVISEEGLLEYQLLSNDTTVKLLSTLLALSNRKVLSGLGTNPVTDYFLSGRKQLLSKSRVIAMPCNSLYSFLSLVTR